MFRIILLSKRKNLLTTDHFKVEVPLIMRGTHTKTDSKGILDKTLEIITDILMILDVIQGIDKIHEIDRILETTLVIREITETLVIIGIIEMDLISVMEHLTVDLMTEVIMVLLIVGICIENIQNKIIMMDVNTLTMIINTIKCQ